MSTEFTGRNSSRVLRPPGGGCSNIFGTTAEPKSTKSDVPNENCPPSQPVDATVQETKTADDVDDVEKDDNEVDAESQTAAAEPAHDVNCRNLIAENAQKGRSGGSGYNPITGVPFDKAAQVSDESKKQNIRVRQPPGGASTKLW